MKWERDENQHHIVDTFVYEVCEDHEQLELICDDIEADETGDWSNGTNNTSWSYNGIYCSSVPIKLKYRGVGPYNHLLQINDTAKMLGSQPWLALSVIHCWIATLWKLRTCIYKLVLTI